MIADYHPFVSTFTLSTGFLFPNFSLAAQAVPNADGSFTIDNVTYTGIDSLGGSLKWTKTSPYFGVGWKPTSGRRGLSFSGDVGVALVGSPEVRLTATGPGASNPLVQSGLAAEQQNLQEASNFKVYPILNFGLLYRFGGKPSPEEETQPKEQEPQEERHGNEFLKD
jgi:hypothetical protein